MNIPCVCKLSYQMLQILEHIHKKYYIHRDIKPDNFLMGIGPNNKFLYIIDLGFAKPYRDLSTLAHIPMTKGQGITGTSRFASINTLSGYTQSRRDDLESLAYVIIYLMIHLYGPRIPYAKSFVQCGYYNVLVMELLGK